MKLSLGRRSVLVAVGIATCLVLTSVAVGASSARNPTYNLRALTGSITADGSSIRGRLLARLAHAYRTFNWKRPIAAVVMEPVNTHLPEAGYLERVLDDQNKQVKRERSATEEEAYARVHYLLAVLTDFVGNGTIGLHLHDTPGRSLFQEPERAFSHGCMRMEKPLELAGMLLAEEGWDRGRIDAAIARRRELAVPLRTPLPVHILYHTAWVDVADRLQLRGDIYGHDRRLAAAMRGAAGPELSASSEGGCESVSVTPS